MADGSDRLGTFGHGFTASGHPVATAVAMENLDVIEERGLVDHVREIAPKMQARLRDLAEHPLVGEARGVGMIGALELVADKQAKTALEKPGQLGSFVNGFVQDNGVISRNMGDTLGFCPPLIITASQIDDLFDRISLSLDQAHAALPSRR